MCHIKDIQQIKDEVKDSFNEVKLEIHGVRAEGAEHRVKAMAKLNTIEGLAKRTNGRVTVNEKAIKEHAAKMANVDTEFAKMFGRIDSYLKRVEDLRQDVNRPFFMNWKERGVWLFVLMAVILGINLADQVDILELLVQNLLN